MFFRGCGFHDVRLEVLHVIPFIPVPVLFGIIELSYPEVPLAGMILIHRLAVFLDRFLPLCGETDGNGSAGIAFHSSEETSVAQPGSADRFQQHFKGSIRVHRQCSVIHVDMDAASQVNALQFAVLHFKVEFAHCRGGSAFFNAQYVVVSIEIQIGAVGQQVCCNTCGGIPGYLIVGQHVHTADGIH